MSLHREQQTLRTTLIGILSAFCELERGRSVAFRGYKPLVPHISIRGDEPRPAASVMKVPLAMTIYRFASQNVIDLDNKIKVAGFSSTRYVSILTAFDPESELSLREICRLALMTSDNPLAVFLQNLANFDAVNQFLREIGCGPPCRMVAGFSEEELGPRGRGNILTADAAVHIMSVLRVDPIYEDLMVALKNNLRNNRIPALLPEHVAVFHKTGSVDGVVNDVGIVKDHKVDFALAFLTDNQGASASMSSAMVSNEIAECASTIYTTLINAV
jgi:beta-lactamase class A